jgi:osmoprotectant transport system permease protein
MEILDQVVAWFADPARWSGPDGIPVRLLEHLRYTGIAVGISLLIALPLGLALGHTGRGGFLAVGAANIGRALPSYALLLIFFPIFGFGDEAPILALVLLSIPPILTNTFVGMREVDRDLVEAGRGVGMTELQVLRGVELPAAMPVILAGIRTSAVQAVATATLAALVAGGGLGRYIVDGFALQDYGRLVGGAILVALLAVLTERAFALLERAAVPRGVRTDTARGLRAQLPDMASPKPGAI